VNIDTLDVEADLASIEESVESNLGRVSDALMNIFLRIRV
jgi:hypothetical protein